MLFRLIEAECGLCCDAKCGNGGGGAKRVEKDISGLKGTYGEEGEGGRIRRELYLRLSRDKAPQYIVSVCFSIIQSGSWQTRQEGCTL